MPERYSLPPGFNYELLPDLRFGIVDRAGEVVLSVAMKDLSANAWNTAITHIWDLLVFHPTLARKHAAAFMTWRLRESPLEHLVFIA